MDDMLGMIKAVILVGGPAKGTRFRPLSLDYPKPLFPIAGYPLIYHHIEACCKVPEMREILIIGFYQPDENFKQFIYDAQHEFNIQIRYLQEFTALGTAGGIYHFRDQIQGGSPEYFFVLNADVCCEFQLNEMLEFHKNLNDADAVTMMTTEATRQQSVEYGCAVVDNETNQILHYVEKPSTFVSAHINCGVYVFSPGIFKYVQEAFKCHQQKHYSASYYKNVSHADFDIRSQCNECIHLEREVFQPLAGSGHFYSFSTLKFWSQVKSAGAAVYANRHQLQIYRETHPERLAENGDGKPLIIGDVFIHPTANVHHSAVIGPNVSIGRHATVESGARLRDCLVLQNAVIRAHACVLNSVLGWDTVLGEWCRVEGTPNDPNPNKPFAKLQISSVFNEKGQLNPGTTVIGSNVEIPAEVVILNSIVLPHKELRGSAKNQIIL